MFKKNVLIAFFLAVILILPAIKITYANNTAIDLPKTQINPGSFYYSFKRLWEKGMTILNFSEESKIPYYDSLVAIRLAELDYVVKNKILSEIETSSQRFAYYAGTLTGELTKLNKSDKNKQVIGKYMKYKVFLEQLRDNFPVNSSYWMLLQHDINSLDNYIEKLNKTT
ncbi:hypothetical protein HYW42_02835 [Candidatus Daviesbacteria bacterium]|nr:hypothetical protein [Candidatus Daviesbacteria bacterium]